MIFHRRWTPQLIFLLFLVGHAGFMHLKTSRSTMDGRVLLPERPKETISAPSEKNSDSVETRRRILEDELSRAALLIHITVSLTQQLELQSADQRGLERSTP